MKQDITSLFAVCNLEGRNINGWQVKTQLSKPNKTIGETGGNFSICYIVEKDGVDFFMKVIDFSKCYKGPLPRNVTRAQYIERCTREFNYEKALSSYCNENRIRSVISYIDDGDITLDDFTFGDVSYIIYEKADGDIRKILLFSSSLVFSEKLQSITVKLKSLHDIAVGIQQLHQNLVSHQDVKPSNILSINNKSKIGDLGRSLCMSPLINCPYSYKFNGDMGYASPEGILDWSVGTKSKNQLYQIDNYMLGSLIVFYICGVSFNTLMSNHLPKSVSFLDMARAGMTYDDAKPYLINAFHYALLDFEKDIPIDEIKEELTRIVEYLCNPDVEKRGHPKNLSSKNQTPNHDLIRVYTELDKLYKKTQIELLKLKKNGFTH